MKDRNLIEQIAAFKKIKVGDNRWRVAFYHIATNIWALEEYYVIIDKDSYKEKMKLPLIREHKGVYAMQIFSSYNKANEFVEKTEEQFILDGKKLIARITGSAFREVFAPFLAEQEWNYIINDEADEFMDTFERLLAVMEVEKEYIVDEEQEKMLISGDIQKFFVDICDKYVTLV